MKYKEVLEGFEVSPSGQEKGVKEFLKKNKYVVGGVIILAVSIGVYYYKKKQQQ